METRHHYAKARARVLTLTGVACCAVLLGACGAGRSSAGTGTTGLSPGIKFADCIRAHGVPNFPDPGASGGGIEIPVSPASQSALKSCQHLLGGLGSGPRSGPPSAQAHARLLQTSQCMRRHGISGFPDPRAGSPPSSLAGYGLILGTGGYFIAVPHTINPASPAFKQAATACRFGPRGR